MFTGIIETIGKVIELNQDDGNLHIVVESPISNELKIGFLSSSGHFRICFGLVILSRNGFEIF